MPHVDVAVTAQWLSVTVGGTNEQTPSVVAPGRLHALQVAWHALAQQTPCSQKPVAHSLAAPQVTPLPLSTQAVPLQVAGAMQSAELVACAQVVLQIWLFGLVVSHANEPGQVLVVAGWQVPAPSQVRAVVKVAPLHTLPTQIVAAA